MWGEAENCISNKFSGNDDTVGLLEALLQKGEGIMARRNQGWHSEGGRGD